MSLRHVLALAFVLLGVSGCGSSGGQAEAPQGLAPVSTDEAAAQAAYEKEYAAKDPKDR